MSSSLDKFDRMPHSVEAEKAVIGCMLQNNDVIDEVFTIITTPEMFYDIRLRAVFSSIAELRREGTGVDKITAKDKAVPILNSTIQDFVRQLKQKAKELEGYDEQSLNDDFFADILRGAAFDTDVMSYCDIVKNKYLLRESIKFANIVIEESQKGEKSAELICNDAQTNYYKLGTSGGTVQYRVASDYIKDFFDELDMATKSKSGITGIPTGYTHLDNYTAGLQNSDMIIIAARPGVGKTTFALNLAYNMCASYNKSILFFSLEMNAVQLVKRIISARSGVSITDIRSGRLSSDQLERIVDRSMDLKGKKFFISETSLLTIADLRNKCQKLKNSKDGLDIVFIDYLQLMKAGDNYQNSSNNKRGFASRQEEVAEISRNIKALAKDLNVPIVALSQLTRDADGSVPKLSDLRESGAIEQDADIVMLIHKPKDDNEEITQIKIAKHRNGSVGDINFKFDKATTRFYELDYSEDKYKKPEAGSVE